MRQLRPGTAQLVMAAGGVVVGMLAFALDRFGSAEGSGARQAGLLAAGIGAILVSLVPRLWVRLALVGASTLMLVGAAELGLRIFAYEHFASILAFDERYHYKPIPGAAHYFDQGALNGGGQVRVQVNSAGYRGEDLDPTRSRPRVLVYGDSNIAAEFSELEQTYPVQLARQLRARGLPVEAINAGVNGYGPDQVALRLEDEIGSIAPAIVVVAIFASNDYGDLIRNKLFGLDSQGRLVRRESDVAPSLRRSFERATQKLMIVRVAYRAWGALQRTQQGPQTAEDILQMAAADWRTIEGRTVTNLLNDYWDADLALQPHSESAQHKVRLMTQLIAHLKAKTASGGARLVLVFIPSPIDAVGSNEILAIDPARYPRHRPDGLVAPLIEAARAQGVPFVDLLSAFRKGDASTYFRRRDDHWSDAGQALAAELTARLIEEAALLPRD